MLKKLALLFILLTSTIFADFQVSIWSEDEDKIILNFNTFYENVGGDEGTNWVAIYKQGDSNDWENVLQWEWANDLAHNEDGNYDERIFPKIQEEGDYEVRFFLNNSYETFASYKYSVKKQQKKPYLNLTSHNYRYVSFLSSYQSEAWIGIYEVGDSNDWENVKAWKWAKKGDDTYIDIVNLKKGEYEARLFYHNSYNVEKTLTFTHENENKSNLSITNEKNYSLATFNSTHKKDAWIGIFEKGASNDWENVKAWSWTSSMQTHIDILTLEDGDYEARLFFNNSYIVEKTVNFSIDNQSIEKKIYRDINSRYNFDHTLMLKKVIKLDESKALVQWFEGIDSVIAYYKIEDDAVIHQKDLISNHNFGNIYSSKSISLDYASLYNNEILFSTSTIKYKVGYSELYSLDLNKFDNPSFLTKEEIRKNRTFIDPSIKEFGKFIYKSIDSYQIYFYGNTIKIISNITKEVFTKDFQLKRRYEGGDIHGHGNIAIRKDNILSYYGDRQQPYGSPLIEFDISNLPNIELIKEY